MEPLKSLEPAEEPKLLETKKSRLTGRKIILFAVFVLAVCLAYYLWQTNQQKDVQEINKTLPQGIKIAKNLKNEYSLVNDIDNYEFPIPAQWQGLDTVEYTPTRTASGYIGSSIFLMGKQGPNRTLSVDAFQENENKDLKQWAEDFADAFDLNIVLGETQLAGLSLVTSYDENYLNGTFLFFLKVNGKVYLLSGGSDDPLKEIISNGRWW